MRVEALVNVRGVDRLKDGVDVALQFFPPASNSLIERRLFPVRGLFCASPDYLGGESEIETPLDLLRHDFACYSYYPWGEKWPLIKGEERFQIALSPVLKTNSVHLLLDFARAGAGVPYLPTMAPPPTLPHAPLPPLLPRHSPPPPR